MGCFVKVTGNSLLSNRGRGMIIKSSTGTVSFAAVHALPASMLARTDWSSLCRLLTTREHLASLSRSCQAASGTVQRHQCCIYALTAACSWPQCDFTEADWLAVCARHACMLAARMQPSAGVQQLMKACVCQTSSLARPTLCTR